MSTRSTIHDYIRQLQFPSSDSHKGQNGKALIIGGSDLFHAASRWSFLAASRLVDMTFYSSVAENNQLLYDAKFYAHDGVVVPRRELPAYIAEADSILIGPGMRRDFASRFTETQLHDIRHEDLSDADWENDTIAVTRVLTALGTGKKWVIDAGALQVIHPEWFPEKPVLTPHPQEFLRLSHKLPDTAKETIHRFLDHDREVLLQHAARLFSQFSQSPTGFSRPPEIIREVPLSQTQLSALFEVSRECRNATFLVKGPTDIIWNENELVLVSGGNASMTKGGTGDVLAGSLVGFLATSEPFVSTVVASYLNKLAGHMLYQEHGTMFNSSDLVEMVPHAWREVEKGTDP
ncbi:NAD(P)H-hydrate dehydratase [Candidatus Woesebacteria bacterium]|nr:NAD(P)H-hydrate dehydratase [Candidatus Woesebacteria bacterium]MCD8506988.1 NAD(P)H-hydrate dehydratase [Candidatus Woesebacteria bacterium]MCD8527279.1 NAD(P)H-hydrate dehydratase [Candidatus Woesebacteria bacterium]MCD8546645.1 NAD(P)H-hydrate dehydratase [Candidatus Woesebacteria bacterium]